MSDIDSVRLPSGTDYTVKDSTAQTKNLVTPITVDGVQQTTVEGALGAINNKPAEGSNPNLLINPWFTVNQRGVTSGQTNSAYTLDRWKADYDTAKGTWSLGTNGVTVTPA